MAVTGQSSWLAIVREALSVLRAFQDKTRRVCPNPNCPLKMNVDKKKSVEKKLTQNELVEKHKAMYKRNHPNG